MPKLSYQKKNKQRYYLTHSWGYKGVHTYPKVRSPKMNEMVRLEFELGYFEAQVHHDMWTPHTH